MKGSGSESDAGSSGTGDVALRTNVDGSPGAAVTACDVYRLGDTAYVFAVESVFVRLARGPALGEQVVSVERLLVAGRLLVV